MRRLGVLMILVAGCSFSPPGGGGGAPSDGGPDGDKLDAPDGSMACTPWATRAGHVTNLCSMPPGPAWMVTANTTFDTMSGTYTMGSGPTGMTVTQPGGDPLYVISVESFSVADGATLRVVGNKPLLVLSWSTMQIDGIIDVSSIRNGATVSNGAGANRSACDTGDDGMGGQDSGGGGGGGYQNGGGRGGDGSGPGTNGGNPAGSINRQNTVVSGCLGGKGGGAGGGQGGASGGAIQLTAKMSITLAGTAQINAGGQGGQGGQGDRGGGGGGSGGFIGLDASMVTVSPGALLAANGGGGGTGCDGTPTGNVDGGNGSVGTARAPGGPTGGCQGGNAGGRGGAAGNSTERTGENGTNSSGGSGGGGGGGGVGYIVIWAGQQQFMGIASPDHEYVSN